MDKLEKKIGVYEALRSYNGVFALLPEHQERLDSSCEKLGLKAPDLSSILTKYASGNKRVRVDVFEYGNVNLQAQELPDWEGNFLFPELWKIKAVRLTRERPELKSSDTSAQYEAREEAKAEGFDEILLVDDVGNITEGGITNVWFVEADHLVTPGENMLPGIARSLILRAAQALDIEVIYRQVALTELEHFDAVFLSNSIRGMVATGPVHPLMSRLSEWCSQFIEDRIEAFRRESINQTQS